MLYFKRISALFIALSLCGLGFTNLTHADGLAISITNPTYNATLSATVSIDALVQQGDSAASVQFAIDGTALGTPAFQGQGTNYFSTWDTTTAANGQHTLTATVSDNGVTATSSSVAVTVMNAGSSVLGVTITAPAATATISGLVTAIATVVGPYAISNVQFLLNGNDMGTAVNVPDTAGAYDLPWNTVQYQNGNYTLSAVVTDSYGHKATAASSVSVTIYNALSTDAPSVVITSPLASVTITKTVQITATVIAATDGAIIQNVQFMLDGNVLGTPVTAASTTTGSTATYVYSWDTTTATEGSHLISAVATDSAGKTGASLGINVAVANLGPAASITAPTASAALTGSTVLTATVTPNITTTSPIASVQFMVDGKNVGVPVTAATGLNSFSYTWDSSSISNGAHTISATALDLAGHVATTTVVNVTTSNSNAPAATIPVVGIHPNNTLVNLNGTFYIIKNNTLLGVTNPGILQSLGYSFSDAVTATTGDAALAHASGNAEPNDGALVKTADDLTVYLIADQQRHGFTSSSVFTGLGYKFSSVLVVTGPELNVLALSGAVSSSTVQHLRGADVSSNGTVYWLDDSSRHPYASVNDYNSWHVANDFSTVVPANQADLALPLAAAVVARVK